MTVESLRPPGRRFEYLDLLRLLCAASVAIFHSMVVSPFTGLTPGSLLTAPCLLTYGQFGVEVFFMISGFVITLSSHGRTVRQFLWARFLRLYPAYWICCGLTAIVIVAIGTGDHTLWTLGWARFLANMTMFNGFADSSYVDQVYWSLRQELLFYAYVAILLLVGRRIDSLPVLAAWLAACAVAPFAPHLLGAAAMTDYAPFFVIGILAQTMLDRRRLLWKVAMLAIALLLASQSVIRQAAAFAARGLPAPDPAIAVALVWAGALLVLASAFLHVPQRFGVRMMRLGTITYPLYLFHNVAGALFTARFARYMPAWLALAISAVVVVAIVGTIAVVLEPALRKAIRAIGDRLIGSRGGDARATARKDGGRPDEVAIRG